MPRERWGGARTSFSLCWISHLARELVYGCSPHLLTRGSFSMLSSRSLFSPLPSAPSLHIWALPSGHVQRQTTPDSCLQSAAAVSWFYSNPCWGLIQYPLPGCQSLLLFCRSAYRSNKIQNLTKSGHNRMFYPDILLHCLHNSYLIYPELMWVIITVKIMVMVLIATTV